MTDQRTRYAHTIIIVLFLGLHAVLRYLTDILVIPALSRLAAAPSRKSIAGSQPETRHPERDHRFPEQRQASVLHAAPSRS